VPKTNEIRPEAYRLFLGQFYLRQQTVESTYKALNYLKAPLHRIRTMRPHTYLAAAYQWHPLLLLC
jgi:hypothetical protein